MSYRNILCKTSHILIHFNNLKKNFLKIVENEKSLVLIQFSGILLFFIFLDFARFTILLTWLTIKQYDKGMAKPMVCCP